MIDYRLIVKGETIKNKYILLGRMSATKYIVQSAQQNVHKIMIRLNRSMGGGGGTDKN
jgi:hypothetical protein